jgi:hypothetical protein
LIHMPMILMPCMLPVLPICMVEICLGRIFIMCLVGVLGPTAHPGLPLKVF